MLLNADLEINNFNVFLHQLRTIELQNMPEGAKIFLSGGCSGVGILIGLTKIIQV